MSLLRLSPAGLFFVVAWALLVAGGIASAQPAASVAEGAHPPLWIVERDGQKLYLFGSMHMLPPEAKWQSDELAQARAASQVFVFEAPLDPEGRDMTRFVEKEGRMKDGRRLKDAIGAKLHGELEAAAWGAQCSPKMFETFRPWMAGVYLELCGYIKLGFSRYFGVDHVIEQEARERKAELDYFETVEEQLSYFATLDRKAEIAYLRGVVRNTREDPELPARLLSAWETGDVKALTKLVDDGFREVPSLRRRLLVARNTKWVSRIRVMLASDKTHFVTVGVGHLVGRDSVVAMLRRKGYKVLGP